MKNEPSDRPTDAPPNAANASIVYTNSQRLNTYMYLQFTSGHRPEKRNA